MVAIPVGVKHVQQAIRLLNWLAELDGGSRHPCLLVVARETSYETIQELLKAAGKAFCNISAIKATLMDKQRQPDTDDLLFRSARDYSNKVTKQPFFWLGVNSFPMNAGWMNKVELSNHNLKRPIAFSALKDYQFRSEVFPEFASSPPTIAVKAQFYEVLRPEWPMVQNLTNRSKREPSITLIYIHVPGDEKHWKYARAFVETYKAFPPGYPHNTVVVCQGKPAVPLVKGLFKIMPNLKYFEHDDSGWDIGGYIAAAQSITDDCVVCLGGSTYFNQNGWLARIAAAWKNHGLGFYGATPTYEVSPHLCTSGFWCHPEILRRYPIKVASRETRYDFEHGPNACWKMVYENGLPVKLVTWDGEYDWQDWRNPPNIYRRGDQSNSLIQWSHYREYEKATPQAKATMASHADTLTDPEYLNA